MTYAIGKRANTAGQQAHTLPCVRCGKPCRVYRRSTSEQIPSPDEKLWMACRPCRTEAADDVHVIEARLRAEVEARMAELPRLPLTAGMDAWNERHALVRATWAEVTRLHLAGVAAA